MRLVRLAALVVAASVSASVASAEVPVRTTIPDLAGRPVVIEVTVGQLSIEGWSRPGVEVEIVSDGREAAVPDALDAQVLETPELLTIRAVQPRGGKDSAIKARVSVRLPATATIQRADVFEGTLSLQTFRGDVRATIERGPLTARGIAGLVRLETSSGDLLVTDAELTKGGLLRLRTFNGNITLALARRPADARVLILTLNGAIRSDLPLSERAGFGPRFREGVFGAGEPLISIDAVRGDITITAPER